MNCAGEQCSSMTDGQFLLLKNQEPREEEEHEERNNRITCNKQTEQAEQIMKENKTSDTFLQMGK